MRGKGGIVVKQKNGGTLAREIDGRCHLRNLIK